MRKWERALAAVLALSIGEGRSGAGEEAREERERPEAAEQPGIADNSFFLEEAYNQEPGVVQNILTATWFRSRQAGARTDDFELAFTQEWPVSGVAHQLSYTIPFQWLRGDQPHEGGLADVFLNYRYQLLEESDSRPAVAPRFSLVLPTGDEDRGLGRGDLGYQFSIPLSKKIGDLFHVHLNAGATLTPGAEAHLEGGGHSSSHFLVDYRLGFSVIFLLRNNFNLLVELFATRLEEIESQGGRKEEVREMVFSPGARYAVNLRSGSQLVLGAAVPLGLTDESNDFGVFLYLSFEGALWKPGTRG